MPFAIEMTMAGVLQAGGWRTSGQLNTMSADAQRSAIIETLSGLSTTDFRGWDDESLIGGGAVTVVLQKAKIRSDAELKTMPHDDHRNTLIVENGGHTGRSGEEFWAMNNQGIAKVALQWVKVPGESQGEPTFVDPDNKTIDRTILGYFQMIFERARMSFLSSNLETAADLLKWINGVFPTAVLDTASDDYKNVVDPFVTSISSLTKICATLAITMVIHPTTFPQVR
jgi:hypothetical protein